MYSTAFLAVVAFVLCLVLTPVVRAAALRLGLLDRPDFGRKLHARPVARIGGVAVALSYVAAFGVFMLSPLAATAMVGDNIALALALLPAGAMVFSIGLLDDIVTLKPWQKLAGQVCAASLAYWSGVRIVGIAGHGTEGWLSFPVTLFWLVLCTNAFNLIDGMDGLAAGLGFLAALTTLVAAVLHSNVALALATAPLAGCLLAFLRYNFSPATIFLGDSGSLLIGFLLGCFGVVWSHKSATLLGMAAPLMAIAIPLLDTSLAVTRRFLRNTPIFKADRSHLHHLLLDRGLTPRRAVLLFYVLAVAGAAFSLTQDLILQDFAALVPIVFCACALVGIHFLGLVEVDAVRELFLNGSLRRMVDKHIKLRSIERELKSAMSVHDCWKIIRVGAREFGFIQVKLTIGDTILEEHCDNGSGRASWLMRVPLAGDDHIDFEHDRQYIGPDMIGPFLEVICRQLNSKERVCERSEKVTTAGR